MTNTESTGTRPTPQPPDELRRRAEAALANSPGPDEAGGDPRRLQQELEVHRVELEMQNEELRKVCAELAESRDRYHELYDHAPVGYLTLDSRGTICSANLAACRLFHEDRHSLVGRPASAYMAQGDADVFHRHLQEALASGGRSRSCELQLRGPGAESPTSVRIDSLAAGDGDGNRECRSVMIDVTELEQAESRLRLIADHVEDVFLLRERATGRFAYVNRAFETMWGRPVDDMRSADAWFAWVHPADRDRVTTAWRRVDADEPFGQEFRICRPDGEVRWVRARTCPIRDDDGTTRRDVTVIHDVTNERELEDDLRHARKMEVVGALASGVAHDFNNVLQAVLGCLSVARDGVNTGRARQFLDGAASMAHRGGQLARQLTAFSRKQHHAPGPVNVDELIRGLSGLIDRLVGDSVNVEVATGAPGRTVHADAVQIERILMNLAANARDAMPDGGTLSIRTDSVEADAAAEIWPDLVPPAGSAGTGFLRLVVEDNGTGMDESARARAFEPFFTTRDIGRGTGLGLATVHAITRALGGHVEVDSAPGRGTRFTFAFPSRAACTVPAGDPGPQGARFRGTALVVEDESYVRVTLCSYLEELGFSVLEAADASDAETVWLRSQSVDVLITDVAMPDGSGPDLAARLRHDQPSLPVLYISADPDLLDRLNSADATAVLQKPFSKDALAHVLMALTEHTKPADG